ncbi:MAG: NAD-dependent epimerase/dehydratase family protein [Gemmatimonadaceae bacterium]|nr:NAD-dependent epimerase/dehydratase family protein [Gemmatimonadaceae bacterium]
MTKRALVTGGAGFIGSHIADALLDRGFAVVVLDDLSSGRRENIPAAAEFAELDVRSAEAARLVREGGFEVVIHQAAQIDVRKSVADPVHDASVNILGALNLLEAVRAAAHRPRFVFASTGGAIYGDFVTPPNVEEYAKDPDSPYGIAKLAVEHYLAYYGRIHGLEGAVLRYANVYGPRQDPHGEAGVVAIFCNRLLEGKPLTVFGDGRQTRDYVHVKDVAVANAAVATAPLPALGRLDARAMNIGTGVETDVITLADTLRRVSGRDVPIEFAPARIGEQQRSAVSIDKVQQVLGWTPQRSLAAGLKETFEFFAARR